MKKGNAMRFFGKVLGAIALAWLLAGSAAHAQVPFYQCQIIWNQNGVSNTSPTGVCSIDPNRMMNGAGVGILLTISSGASLTATVQVTGDLPINIAGGGNWNNHDTLVNEISSANGNLQFPVTGLRLNVTNYVSGTVTMTVIQPSIPKG